MEGNNSNEIIVTNLFVYPIKSCHEVELEVSNIVQNGLVNDRTLVLVNKNTMKAITIRTHPLMYFIKSNFDKSNPNMININVPGDEKEYTINLKDDIDNLDQSKIVNIFIWELPCDIYPVETENNALNKALSAYLNDEVMLYKPVNRREFKNYLKLEKMTGLEKESDGSYFADLSPLLIVSQESYDYTQKIMKEKGDNTLRMVDFRPNIVLKGGKEEFWENKLDLIQIGDVIMRRVKPRVLCKVPTFDSVNKQFRKSKEPLEVLNDVAFDDYMEGVIFGQHFSVDFIENNQSGYIKVGDTIKILEQINN